MKPWRRKEIYILAKDNKKIKIFMESLILISEPFLPSLLNYLRQ